MKQSVLLLSCALAASFACIGCSLNPRESNATEAASTSPAANPSGEAAGQRSLEASVLQNERKVWEAFKAKDVNTVNALLAEEAQVVSVDGRFSMSEFLRMVSQLPEIQSYMIVRPKVISPTNDVAILTYESRYVTREPESSSHSGFQTTVWVNRAGKWLAIFNQETQLPQGRQ